MRGDVWLGRTFQVIFVVLLYTGWAWATAEHKVNLLLLPDPHVVFSQMGKMIGTGALAKATFVTIWEIVRAYLLASLLGLVVGFLISRSYRTTQFLEPIFAAIFTVPLVFLLPLFIFYFGIGPTTKVAFGGVYAFFPVVLTSIASFSGTEKLFVRSAQSMGANQWQLFRHIYFPSALPGVINGLRLATIICIASVLGAETISAAAGLGHQISVEGELMNTATMFAWILYVVIAAIIINMGLTALEGWAQRRTAGA